MIVNSNRTRISCTLHWKRSRVRLSGRKADKVSQRHQARQEIRGGESDDFQDLNHWSVCCSDMLYDQRGGACENTPGLRSKRGVDAAGGLLCVGGGGRIGHGTARGRGAQW